MPETNQLHLLLQTMRTLRSEPGCAWDKAQTHASLIPFLREETNELIDAIAKEDFFDIKEELGDVLFQLVFHAHIASENEEFTFNDVIEHIHQKMLRRHPHVFGDTKYANQAEQKNDWNLIKLHEKRQHPHFDHLLESSILSDTKAHHCAMKTAIDMQKSCAEVGFDWPCIKDVFLKLDEESKELQAEIVDINKTDINKTDINQIDINKSKLKPLENNQDRIEEEFGDLMFVMMNLARHLSLDPDVALRKANHKFKSRFQYIEKALIQKNKRFQDTHLEEMEILWQEAKAQ